MKVSRAPCGRIVFELARPNDDAAVRALLREQAMGGAVRVSLQREPDARLAAGIEGDRHYMIVARDRATDRVVALCSRAVRDVFVNGKPARLGYLGQLRRDPTIPRQRRLLVEGFAACARTHQPDELPYDLTSIVADNMAARRLLERGLPGLPTYRPLCEFVTLVIPVGRMRRRRASAGRRVLRGCDELLPAIAACLQRNYKRRQFAPAWSTDDLRSPVRTRGLHAQDFFVACENERVIGCLARWDQRGFKQTVIDSYASRLARWRPVVNVALAFTGRPHLPRPGQQLQFAYLSHVAVDEHCSDVLIDLIDVARNDTVGSGVNYLIIGMAAENLLLGSVRRAFRGREYRSLLYLAHYSDAEPAVDALDDRIVHVEVATI